MRYLSEAMTPLVHVKNPHGQIDEVPESLVIVDPEREARRVKARDDGQVNRSSKPTVRAIADYLGLDEPACMICWSTPVERAHARPVALEGSNDVRNFALLCRRHHREAPDVENSNSFWQWVDWRLDIDHPLASRKRPEGQPKETDFFVQVRHELLELYGWTENVLAQFEWSAVMKVYYKFLDAKTTEHFGVKRKASTHAWAFDCALRELSSATG